jgi:1-acyl-sn-glycerol-3-phosphate acyltransferase
MPIKIEVQLRIPAFSNSYHSPQIEQTWLASHFPTLAFYSKLVSVVWKASLEAKKNQYTSTSMARDSQNIFRDLESVGVRFYIDNLKVLQDLKKPCVFIGNHMSALETFILPGILQPFQEITFVVKKSLMSYPVFKHVMISQNPVVVGRKNPREDLRTVLDEGLDRLRQKISVVIFPQHTRTLDLDVSHFNTLGIKLAQRAGVPVVPIALRTDAWGNGPLIKDFGRIGPEKPVRFYFGDPLTIKKNVREIHQHIVSLIKDKLNEWF